MPKTGDDRLHPGGRARSRHRRAARRRTEAPAGPHRDRPTSRRSSSELLLEVRSPDGGYGKAPATLHRPRFPTGKGDTRVGNGDVLIAAITSCTNTSNPGVLLAAGLLAKKAVERGLASKPRVKTSLAPGSRVVTEYLTKAGLLPYLEQLGFDVVALRLHDLHRQRRPARSRDRRGGHEERPRRPRRCSRATATSRRASTRTSRRTSCVARRSSSPSRSPARCDVDLTTEPLGKGKKGEDVWIERRLADRARRSTTA